MDQAGLCIEQAGPLAPLLGLKACVFNPKGIFFKGDALKSKQFTTKIGQKTESLERPAIVHRIEQSVTSGAPENQRSRQDEK